MEASDGLAASSSDPDGEGGAPVLRATGCGATAGSIALAVGGIVADAALVGASRGRMRRQLAIADRSSGLLTGGSLLVAVAAWLLLAPPRSVAIGAFAGCVVAFTIAACVEFEIGPGCAIPTTPVQIVMLFVLPPQLVPVAVLSGLAAAAVIAGVRDPARRERALVVAGSGWQVVGPAAVFTLAHVHRPALSELPILVLALAAQFVLDAATSWVRNCFGLGVPARQVASALQFSFLCDLSLAPIGFAAALAVPNSVGAMLFLLPPTALLAMLQSDRRAQIDKTVALGAAFVDTSDLARRDPLTGVSNRLAWEEAIAQHERSDSPIGVVLADVDGLKVANDTHGHDMGDRLIVAVVETLTASPLPSGATVHRIGGDEFAILVPFADPASTLAVASSMRAAFRAAPSLDGTVRVSASVGAGFASSGRALGKAIAAADQEVNREKTARGVRRR